MARTMKNNLDRQAVIFGKYLIKKTPNSPSVKKYGAAVKLHSKKLDNQDMRLLELIEKHPTLTPFVDAALAFVKPHSEVRPRIYLLFAILESTPEYWQEFIPKKRNPLYIFTIFSIGVRSVFRAIVGIVVVKVYA